MMLSSWLIVDLMLSLVVIVLAWLATTANSVKRAILLFITFGLVMTLVWVRLDAPDLALAEAAIGAGISGVLMLCAYRSADDSEFGLHGGWNGKVVTAALIGLGLLLAVAVLPVLMEKSVAPTAVEAMAQLENSGVENPVTAVLLNFRAYDTLLELAVLFAAALGAMALQSSPTRQRAAPMLLKQLLIWVAPLLLVFGGYLLWVGAFAPGGAFQSGAVLAGALILLQLTGQVAPMDLRSMTVRTLLSIGVMMFLWIGLILAWFGEGFLHYPPQWAPTLILVIELAAMLGIALALSVMVPGAAHWRVEQATSVKELSHDQ